MVTTVYKRLRSFPFSRNRTFRISTTCFTSTFIHLCFNRNTASVVTNSLTGADTPYLYTCCMRYLASMSPLIDSKGFNSTVKCLEYWLTYRRSVRQLFLSMPSSVGELTAHLFRLLLQYTFRKCSESACSLHLRFSESVPTKAITVYLFTSSFRLYRINPSLRIVSDTHSVSLEFH